MTSSLPPLQYLLKFINAPLDKSLDIELDSHVAEGLSYMTECDQIITVQQDTIFRAQSQHSCAFAYLWYPLGALGNLTKETQDASATNAPFC